MTSIALSRRSVIAGAVATLPFAHVAGAVEPSGPLTAGARQRRALAARGSAAAFELGREPPAAVADGDEERYADRRASFSKTLPHGALGEVDPAAYSSWLAILADGSSAAFAGAPRDPSAVERLNNPQAAYALDLAGPDGAALSLAPPPSFASATMAADMAELYWQALMRDVPFRAFADHPLAAAAAADLTAVGASPVAAAELYRGTTAGERRGPYVSQFLWRDIPFGLKTVDQRFRVSSRGQAFLTSFPEWLACQRGARAAAALRIDGDPRYISSFRELGDYVHRDFSFQAFMNAALIAFRMGADDVLSPANPYRGSRTEFGDITFGNKNVLTLLAQVSLLAQKTAYYHKWLIHRRARPEAFGGRLEVHLGRRKAYDIHPAILDCEGLQRVKVAYGSWLLPQAYPEGCPTHPSYPAAHAVNAAACATVLKAFFDDAFVVPDPVEATADGAKLEPWRGEALTLGGEFDKLAANIAFARDAAGVHFRSDSERGLQLGEEVAIGMLADASRTYSEERAGFVLRRFDGTKLAIAQGAVARVA